MAARNNAATLDEGTLILSRLFDAPVGLVWRAWTEDAHLRQWSALHG